MDPKSIIFVMKAYDPSVNLAKQQHALLRRCREIDFEIFGTYQMEFVEKDLQPACESGSSVE